MMEYQKALTPIPEHAPEVVGKGKGKAKESVAIGAWMPQCGSLPTDTFPAAMSCDVSDRQEMAHEKKPKSPGISNALRRNLS